jgi:acetyltransferase-like isoleucine patch superfamily enzyme
MNELISRKKYGEHRLLRLLFNKFICFIAMMPMFNPMRLFLYSLAGVKIGKNVFIASYVLIDDQFPELVRINNNVVISYKVTILTHDGAKGIIAPVDIENNSFIGACSIILPGVIIGENSIVGAGTLVSKDVTPKSTVVSSCLRVINTR